MLFTDQEQGKREEWKNHSMNKQNLEKEIKHEINRLLQFSFYSLLKYSPRSSPNKHGWLATFTKWFRSVFLNAFTSYLHPRYYTAVHIFITHTITVDIETKNMILTHPEGMSWLEKWSKASGEAAREQEGGRKKERDKQLHHQAVTSSAFNTHM